MEGERKVITEYNKQCIFSLLAPSEGIAISDNKKSLMSTSPGVLSVERGRRGRVVDRKRKTCLTVFVSICLLLGMVRSFELHNVRKSNLNSDSGLISERERANLVVSKVDFFFIYIFIYFRRWMPLYCNILKYAHKSEIS